MNLIGVYQDSTECSNLSMSDLSIHFVNGSLWGSYAALQPAWRITENQWGHSCVGGLPEGIIWFSSNTLWNKMAKQCGGQRSIRKVGWAKLNMHVAVSEAWERFHCQHGRAFHWVLNKYCVYDRAQRWSSISCQLIVMTQLISDVVYLSKPDSTDTCTQNILWN